jgi:XTP/dITP diphosphohydrolase
MTFVLASNNIDKLKELRVILSGFGLDVLSQKDAGLDFEAEETGETFYDNALIKAKAAMELSGLPAISDDSGLMVDFLNGGPGVYSKRYGGDGLDDTDRYRLLLQNMAQTEQRGAKFVSCIVCCFPNGDIVSAEGACPGTILRAPRGSGGFGYDPVFLVAGTDKSMAELTPEEKNAVSHRGTALRAFETKLRAYLAEN